MGFPSAAQPNNRTALRWGYLIQINFGAAFANKANDRSTRAAGSGDWAQAAQTINLLA